MDASSQANILRSFQETIAQINQKEIAGDGVDRVVKQRFHRIGKTVMRMLAARAFLGQAFYSTSISSNPGGSGIYGEVTLHLPAVYVQFTSLWMKGEKPMFVYRTCAGTADTTGGVNNWAAYDLLSPANFLGTCHDLTSWLERQNQRATITAGGK